MRWYGCQVLHWGQVLKYNNFEDQGKTDKSRPDPQFPNFQRVFADFGKLSKERKKEVTDFIAHLKAKEELEATKEVLADKDFLRSIMRGDEDFKAGRSHEAEKYYKK